jgi:glycosyltransferase involved in cell wall biosynthesis
MESFPLIVLIPTHGRPTLLKRTLDSLAQCALPDSYQELVVIENGSRAGAEAVVADLPARLNARYMHCERGNKSYALNEALETMADGLVVFFDDDVKVNTEALIAYAQRASAMATSTESHFFGGRFLVEHEESPPDWMLAYLPPSAKGCWYDGGAELDDSFTGFLGFNWAAYVDDIKEVGGFNVDKGPGAPSGSTGQETDMQKRLVAHGVKAHYVDNAVVTHYVPSESCTPEWALRRSFRSGVKDGINYANKKKSSRTPFWLLKARMNDIYYFISGICSYKERYKSRYWGMYHKGFYYGIKYEGTRKGIDLT